MSLETNLPKIDQQLSSNGHHGAAIVYLGQLALANPALEDLLADATTLIAQVLPTDLVLIWELETDREHLSLKTISGWQDGIAVYAQMSVEAGSLEDFVLRSPHPVLIRNLETETRFKPSPLLQEYAAISGIGLRIGTAENPCGLIEVFSQQSQTFSQNNILFLQSMANILASFMDAKRREAQWARTQQELRKELINAQTLSRSGHIDWDNYEIKSRLVESRERERLRLAQDLHDIPIQDLYGLMYQMDDLKDILKDAHGMEILEDFNHTLHRVVNSLRTICGELRPPSLSPFGLEVAIRDHVEKVRTSNPELQIHLELMRDQQILSDGIRLCLFRIYQQALNNVIRHAQATDVHIRFQWDDLMVVLEIEDNGHGFELPVHWVDLVRREHFGLAGIAESVESVHGKLDIISAPGDGTMIRISIPRR